MKKVLPIIILIVAVLAIYFIFIKKPTEDVGSGVSTSVEGQDSGEEQDAFEVVQGFVDDTIENITGTVIPSEEVGLSGLPVYTLNEAGEKVYTEPQWIGNTFYSFEGGFSLTIPGNWVQMTPGQYNMLYDRNRNTMHLGTVDDADNPNTQLGMARVNLRSALVKINNTHDRVMNQFQQDDTIGVNEIPTFLTPIDIAGIEWYWFKAGSGKSLQYFYGTCINEKMYLMWIYHDDAYPVEDILSMFGTLDELGEHGSPDFDRTVVSEKEVLEVEVPLNLPKDMPLRILGMAPDHIPIDFQEEIRQGIRPEGLIIPERESFTTHIAMQVDADWLWDLTTDTVTTLTDVPHIKDGRTMVPVRIIAEILGADVGWFGETKTVTITLKDESKPQVGSFEQESESVENEEVGRTSPLPAPTSESELEQPEDVTEVENEEENSGQDYRRTVTLVLDELNPEHLQYGLDVPATRIGATTFVPLRFVSEFLGAEVYWTGSPYRQIDIIK